VLGHFDYTGSFTGFAFADFLSTASPRRAEARHASFTQLQNRIGIFASDDFRVRNDLTLNLGLLGYTSPLVEKDDRQLNIDLATGQFCSGAERREPRALRRVLGRLRAAARVRLDPSEKWAVRGRFGIVQYMEGTGKNLRLTQNPPNFTEGQRTFDATTGAGTARSAIADVISYHGQRGHALPCFCQGPPAAVHQAVEHLVERKLTDALSAQMGYVGSRASHMVVPFDFNQPEPGTGDPSTWRRSSSGGRSTGSTRTSAPRAAPTRSASVPTTPCRRASASARRAG
jgi:hypothetical protein